MTKKYSLPLLLGLCVAGLALFSMPQLTRSQIVAGPLLGYAWSDTIGWIDLNCQNLGDCSPSFGLSVDADGNVSGLAWSDNIGWVSAHPGDLSGCPQSPCTARLSGSDFSGWLRAVSGGTAQSGGWDGFISLSGPGYGVSGTGGNLTGFGWGSLVVGWTEFLLQGPEAPEEEEEEQEDDGEPGGPGDPGGEGEDDEENQCVPTTFSCNGNAIQDNCGGLTLCPSGNSCIDNGVSVVCVPPPSANITATPPLVQRGGSVTVKWSSVRADSCVVTSNTNGDTWTGLSGSEPSSAINSRTVYTVICQSENGPVSDIAIVTLAFTFEEPSE